LHELPAWLPPLLSRQACLCILRTPLSYRNNAAQVNVFYGNKAAQPICKSDWRCDGDILPSAKTAKKPEIPLLLRSREPRYHTQKKGLAAKKLQAL